MSFISLSINFPDHFYSLNQFLKPVSTSTIFSDISEKRREISIRANAISLVCSFVGIQLRAHFVESKVRK